ncbi:MAG TPA: F0F1 ATP synthase subunit B [Candidatus Paceibacterota bacterium]
MKEILDIFGIDTRLLLVQVFNFGILVLALWYFLYRPLIALLARRQLLIEEGVKDAYAAKEEREKTITEREDIITDATHEASIIIDRAKERAQEKEALLLQEAQARSERMLADARMQSEEEKKRARETNKKEIATMAILGAEKILREKI